MPRNPRKKSRTGIYHIVFRGVNRQTIFEDEQDKRVFLRTLAKFKEKSCVELYGYCLMDNHVHLLVKETEESISDFMKRVSSSYVYWYNAKYKRCGHLFQGRFYSESVEDAKYFVTALRYIHQNPLKAGLVRSVWDSKWTSVHEYVRKRRIVDIDKGLRLFSPDRKVALTRYSDFMERENDDQCLEVHERVTLSDDEVREYFRKVGVVSSSMLQQMERSERNALLAKVKQVDGVSIRQLSRVTGISKSVIARV
ncbi:Transposase IS200 like protein [Bacillus sp. THAF10]|uniref:transposase n=1 Tax=Bacillus sp. THAF10 TaxID=2587848 RepID=UPI001267EB09|nr:transposase [Bacillus sp. THAF10]QFT90784.1 Transposase IS200 like protein [Bacillus sp. THAF10]